MAPRSTGDPVLDGFIAKQIRYGQARRMEALLASAMVAVGVTLLLPGNTFDLPSFRAIANLFQPFGGEDTAGWLATCCGCMRLWALWMNGRKTMPAYRLAGSAFGFFFWFGWSLGFSVTAPPFVPMEPISMVFALFEINAVALVTRDFYAANSFGLRRRVKSDAPTQR